MSLPTSISIFLFLYNFYTMCSLTQSSAGIPIPICDTSPLSLPNSFSHVSAALSPYIPTHQGTLVSQSQPCSFISPPISTNSPFFSISNNSHSWSTRTTKHVNQAIQGSWAESTIKCYTGSIKHFIHFCDSERVPDSLRFPTDEFVLCAFAASSLGRHTGGTPSSHISALKTWHVTHNMEWKGSSRLRYVLNGVHNLAPGSSKQPLRPPR